MLKKYTGSCHCGAVRFEADIDLAKGTSKCNCTICTKTRAWTALIKPDAFRLVSGEAALSDYQFGSRVGHHLFCRHCGVRAFGNGHLEFLGGDFVAIQLSSLDDADLNELGNAPVKYGDGRNNNWAEVPQHTAHL